MTGLLAVSGCAPDVTPSYTDPTPQARLGAIRASEAAKCLQDVPYLVENLAADDAAVRLAAIQALRSITGTTLDYRANASRSERMAAIERWKKWIAQHPVEPPNAHPSASSANPAETAAKASS